MLSSLISFFQTGVAFARQVEVELPGSQLPANINSIIISDYVRYIFNFSIAMAGIIVFGVLVFAGIKTMMSSQNPAALSDAKSRVMDAIVGLVVLLASYIILTTLNPQLVLINPEIKGVNQGIILYQKLPNEPGFDIGKEQKTITSSQGDLGDFQAKAYKFVTPPDYLKVSVFSGVNFSPAGAGTSLTQPEGGLSYPKSISLEYQLPGVYLCKGTDPNKSCKVYQSSSAKIDDSFEDKITSIEFKNPFTYQVIEIEGDFTEQKCRDQSNWQIHPVGDLDSEGKRLEKPLCQYDTSQYGAVLHERANYGGTCDVFISNNEEIVNHPEAKRGLFAGDGVSSLTVFLKPDASEAPRPADKGVTVFEDVNYGGGEKSFGPGEYLDFETIQFDPNPNKKSGINDKVSSLKVDDGNLALLFWDPFTSPSAAPKAGEFGGDCEIFTASDPDLGIDNNKIEDKASSLKVIPIKK